MRQAPPPGQATAKELLRKQILRNRAEMSVADVQQAGAAIARSLLDLPVVRAARVVAAYVSFGSEVPTAHLIVSLAARGVTVLLPVLEDDNSLTWRADGMASAPWRLDQAQVVVLPGLCYDHAGHRLGRGGGSYDRALRDLSAGITTIGLAWDRDIIGAVPVDEHDQSVMMIVTPTRVLTI